MIGLYRGGSSYFRYAEEILSHAGIAWRPITPPQLVAGAHPGVALILHGEARLSDAERLAIQEYVAEGGALVVTGGTAGLTDLLGAAATEPLTEGFLALDPAHPVTTGLTSSLHVFGGHLLEARGGRSIGTVLDADRKATGAHAVVVNRYGRGVTVAIGPDLPNSVLHIQLGAPVWEDGAPAPDGTGPIDDQILKADDGVVLSWVHDRERQTLPEPVPECPGTHPNYPSGDTPWFMQPVADELRELLLKAVCWAAAQTDKAVPLLWYWPRGLKAVGLISHDSDHNVDEAAQTTLRVLDEMGIHSTWCIMTGPNWPNRYTRQTYEQVKAAGHEIALHYNALPMDGGLWSREEFLRQLAWVKAETGTQSILSNKNHYTRWEGKLEFFRWMEDAGVESDQSKGPSKKGNVGYPHGSCLPWFPFDGEEQRFLNVLEIPLQTQDLWLTAPYAIAGQIITMAVRHHGVAHFLFHQNHIHVQPEVAAALRRAVTDGREAGLEWWTGARINNWERLRRKITVTCEAAPDGSLTVKATSPVSVEGAQLLVVLPAGSESFATGDFHGLPALAVRADLRAGENIVKVPIHTAPIAT